MENDSLKAMMKKITIMQKKLERSEHSRRLTEQAKDHYDLVYRFSIEKLAEQKNLLDIKNKELDLVRLKLIAKNKELQEVSTTDGLTKIYNRRKISEIFNGEHIQAQRYKIKFSVVLIDVDWFKLVNDTYGHQTGDLVLFELAQLMKKSLRIADSIGRWGGEEFFIVLPNTSSNDGYILAERIRLKISCYHFQDINQITCSFGITQYMENDSIEQIIKRADTALYKAKEHRNWICIG